MDTVCRVSVPAPRNVDLSDHAPVLNLSLARAWFAPSVQFAASPAVPLSKPGFSTWLPGPVGVLVGPVGVLVRVLVGGTGVFVRVLVGPAPESSEMSSNQMSPVGLPSVISRKVTLVFEPLPHVPERCCQEPATPAHNCSSP